MKRYIFSDVDGTMADNGEISNETKADIRYAQNKDLEFIITTGNPYLDFAEELAKKVDARYLICASGASIVDRESNDKFIFSHPIKKDKAEKLIEFSKSKAEYLMWWTEKHTYVYIDGVKPDDIHAEDGLKAMFKRNKNHIFTDQILGDVLKMDIKINSEQKKEFIDKCDELNLQVVVMNDGTLEINEIGVTKGSAVMEFCKLMEIDIKDVMTIGDSPNDWSMFNLTDHSYAMANADDETKKHVKRHTSAVEQNGLGEAIRDYMFRMKIK